MSEKPRRIITWEGPCPHCNEPVRFRLETDYGTFGKQGSDEDWRASISDKDRQVLASAEASGVFRSYQQAAIARPNVPPLRNAAKGFLAFLARMKPQTLTPQAALMIRSTFPASVVEVYTSAEISAITLNGTLSLFIPTAHITKSEMQADGKIEDGKVKVQRLVEDAEDFHAWIKTRMGYVPAGGGMFLKEMRKRCYGAFSLPEKPRAKGGAA